MIFEYFINICFYIARQTHIKRLESMETLLLHFHLIQHRIRHFYRLFRYGWHNGTIVEVLFKSRYSRLHSRLD